MVDLAQWNKLDVTLNKVLTDDDFSTRYFTFVTMHSMLKSDPNLKIAQTTHYDQAAPYYCKRANTFNFSAIVGIEKQSFFDIN